jgi:hypothetical protein
MNNKLVYFFVSFVLSPLMASQKNILDQEICVVICLQSQSSHKEVLQDYMIIGKHDLLPYDVLCKKKRSEFTIDIIKEEADDYVQFKGANISVMIDNENNIFKRRIKYCYDLYKKHNAFRDPFFVHFVSEDEMNVISLKFTKNQVKQIIKKPSYMHLLWGSLGVIAALVCYCSLSSKRMALLHCG